MTTKGERYLKLQADIAELQTKYAEMIVTRVRELDDVEKACLSVHEALRHFLFEAALAQAATYDTDI